MAPHYHPQMRQWLQNFILLASMAPDCHPYRHQWLQIALPGYRKGSREDTANLLPTGAIDANRDENLEPLTPIGMKFWSH